ncbi:MAG: hypothetical protein ACOWWM_17755, partial [Desulfobacterales bacterium]
GGYPVHAIQLKGIGIAKGGQKVLPGRIVDRVFLEQPPGLAFCFGSRIGLKSHRFSQKPGNFSKKMLNFAKSKEWRWCQNRATGKAETTPPMS